MITKIIAKLQAENTKVKVIAYGAASLPGPPYCVVKPEKDILDRGPAYRIIAHYSKGQQIALDDYIDGDVPSALDGFTSKDRNGNWNALEFDDDSDDPEYIIVNDDKTISRERIYWMPGKNV